MVRLISGPCCDRFGPRKTFAGILIAGAIPSFCAGGVTNGAGLLVVRFFIGILGGSFVPCQVWTTQFFDKPVVGTANSLTAGFGNSGGGVTYFVMPAIYLSLVSNGLSTSTAWRVSFVIPSILIVATAVAMLLCCPDTPTGKWSERHLHVEKSLNKHSMVGTVDVPGAISTEKAPTSTAGNETPSSDIEKKEAIIPPNSDPESFEPNEEHLSPEAMMDTARGEVIRNPTWSEIVKVVLTPQTMVVGACYACSFGAELSINSTLGTYYSTNFKTFSLQEAGNWAAMFGLLNVVFRPLGGFVADLAYKYTGTVWAKKTLLHAYGIVQGAFLIAIGILNSHNQSTMFGLVAGMAFFLEGGNGINFATVPHIHPFANGVVSGFTGAMGNFGGIIFAIIFRYAGTAKGMVNCAW